MPTNLAIDDNLLDLAKKVGKHKTKKAACDRGPSRIYSEKQIEVKEVFGSIDYDDSYDFKQQRKRL